MVEPNACVKEITEYSPPRFERKGFVRLDCNENVVGCSSEVLKKMNGLDREYFSLYPNYVGLNEKVAKYCGVKAEQVLLANGSDDALKAVFDCFVDKEDEAIILEPSFAMFELFLKIRGASIKKIRYKNDLSFPTLEVMNAISDKTRIVVLCNPNNPTGTLIAKEDIVKILQKAKNSIVLVDEAYYEFSKETCSDMIGKFDNLIITRTFSKAFGLAGIRAGYALASKENIGYLNRIYSPYGLNSLAKVAIEAALDDVKYALGYAKEVMEEKATLSKELNLIGVETYPSSSNFFVAKFKNPKVVKEKLKEKMVLVRDATAYPLLSDCLRISVGTKKENTILIEALKDILKPALIFDMDGVLVDVSESYRLAIKGTAELFTGTSVSLDEIQSYKEKLGYNNDWDLTEAIIVSRGKKVEKEKIIGKFQEFYIGKNFDGLIKNEKWMLDIGMLERLSKKYRLGIVTGRPRAEALYAIKSGGAEEFFVELIGMEDVSKGKPDPEGILKMLDTFGAGSAIYFGDTPNDEAAANGAKIGFELIDNDSEKNVNAIVGGYLNEKRKN